MDRRELNLPGGPAIFTVAHTVDDVDAAVSELGDRWQPVAFDVETTGLDLRSDRLRMIQLGTAEAACVIPARFAHAIDLGVLREPLAHNGLFDAQWMQTVGGLAMGGVVERMTDTQTLAHLIDPRPAYVNPDADDDDTDEDLPVGLGLKELAVRYLGAGADRYERALYTAHDLPVSGRGKVWSRGWAAIPDDDPALLDYAAADVVLTARLFVELDRRLTDTERYDIVPIERRITLQAWRIIERGMIVDTESSTTVCSRLLEERRLIEGRLAEFEVVNPDSTQQCRRALLEVGAPMTQLTKTGQLSTSRIVLEGLAEHGSGKPAELAALIRAGRRTKAYATKYAGKLAVSGGIVHPFIRVAGARTGRWAMAEPPIQQWPKQPLVTSTGSYDLRALLRAPEGQVLIACDLSSIETVVGAAVCGDTNMKRAVDKPLGDKLMIYDDLARTLSISRATAKVLVLSGIYGVGNAKLAVLLGTDDLHTVKRLRAETFGGYWCLAPSCPLVNTDPFGCEGHARWEDGFYGGPRRMRRGLSNGDWAHTEREGWPGIRNLFGRWVPARLRGEQADWFTVFNHAVQGAARDLLMRMLLDVVDVGLTPWITVHDEIIVIADRSDSGEAYCTLRDTMQHARHPVLRLPVHATAGPPAARWGTQGKPIR